MASCNLSYSGHTGVIGAAAYVTELTTAGTSRQVRVRISVWAKDYSGNRDASYSVRCVQSGTDTSVGMYQGFYINGDPQDIFDETFYVSIPRGASTAEISLTFTASLISPSAGTRTVTGSITLLPAQNAQIVQHFQINGDIVDDPAANFFGSGKVALLIQYHHHYLQCQQIVGKTAQNLPGFALGSRVFTLFHRTQRLIVPQQQRLFVGIRHRNRDFRIEHNQKTSGCQQHHQQCGKKHQLVVPVITFHNIHSPTAKQAHC